MCWHLVVNSCELPLTGDLELDYDHDTFNDDEVMQSDSDSDVSYDEASYDGQLGEVTYAGRVIVDDEEKSGSLGSDQNIRETYAIFLF